MLPAEKGVVYIETLKVFDADPEVTTIDPDEALLHCTVMLPGEEPLPELVPPRICPLVMV
jgi:hypothetical protein